VRANLMLYPTSTTRPTTPAEATAPAATPGNSPPARGRTRRQVPDQGGKPVPGRVSRERDNPALGGHSLWGDGAAVAEPPTGHRALPSRSCTVKTWHALSPAG